MALADYGAFAELGPLLVLLDRARVMGLDYAADLMFWLPDDVLPGVTQAYGLPVERGASVPMLGARPKADSPTIRRPKPTS